MKFIFTSVCFLFSCSYLFAQLQVQFRECESCDTTNIGQSSSSTVYQYGNSSEYEAVLIADDYGPRIYGDHWHGGVDYNSQESGEARSGDRGDLILSIETGKIRGTISAGYKRLFGKRPSNYTFWNQVSQAACFSCLS